MTWLRSNQFETDLYDFDRSGAADNDCYRRVGMDGSEDFMYHLDCFRPTYQWIAMTKTIIIDARYGSSNCLIGTLWGLIISPRVYHPRFKSDAVPVFVGSPYFNFHVSLVLAGAHIQP